MAYFLDQDKGKGKNVPQKHQIILKYCLYLEI